MTLSTVIIALVFWSAKKCPSCLAGPLCWSGLSDLGERFQAIRCPLPPCPSSYCPQRERTSIIWCFRALVIKLEYPGKQICFLLTSFPPDFMSLNSLVLLVSLSLPEGPASVHSMLCKPRAAGCVSSMFRVSQMKGLKGEKDYRFSIPVIYSLCGLTSNLAFLPSQHCVPASATPATVFAASTLSWARELFSSQPVFRYFSVLRSW